MLFSRINCFFAVMTSVLISAHFSEKFTILGYQSRDKVERRIVFIEDNKQQKFVLKFYDDTKKEEAFCEYLGSLVGLAAGIPINKVELVIESDFFQKIDNGCSLATVHDLVPGRELCKWFEQAPFNIYLKGGIISEKQLFCLSVSNDLCDIIAFDIFLNNRDRHHENCFWDEENMRFYAIDMGDIFLDVQHFPNEQFDSCEVDRIFSEYASKEKIIARDTYYYLKTLSKNDLSVDQKRSLERVCLILEKLTNVYPPEAIFDKWITLAYDMDCIYTDHKKEYFKMFLMKNMYWVDKIIKTIKYITSDSYSSNEIEID